MTDRLLPRRVSVSDLHIKMLVYGAAGVGKTTFAATAADHESLAPVLFLNFEGGLLSVAERGDIDEVQIESMGDLEYVFEALRSNQSGYADYRTIVVDSGSELYSQSLTEAVASSVNRDHNRGRAERTLDDTNLEDYGRAMRQTYRLFRALRDLPRHVIVTAHPKMTYPQGVDKRMVEPVDVGPAFSPQLQIQMMGIFDFVHYMYLDGTDRYLLTQPLGAYKAKTRGYTFGDRLGQVVGNPNLPQMYDLLLESSMADGRPETQNMHTQVSTEPNGEEETPDEDETVIPVALATADGNPLNLN